MNQELSARIFNHSIQLAVLSQELEMNQKLNCTYIQHKYSIQLAILSQELCTNQELSALSFSISILYNWL